MERKALLNILELVKPALATKPLVPMFQAFCFTGDTVYAYSDILGIVAPCELDIQAGVYGETILGLLSNSRAVKLKVKQNEGTNEVEIKMSSSVAKLPYFDSDEFLFEEPDDKWDSTFELDNELLDAIGCCLTTVSDDTTQRGFLGVTLLNIKKDELCHFYSCNGDCMTRYVIASDKSNKNCQYIIPTEFCNALLRTIDRLKLEEEPFGTFSINKDWAVAQLSTGHAIYGRIIKNDSPYDFEELITTNFDEETPFIEIPEGMEAALKRAMVVVDKDTLKTELSIEGGKMKLLTESSEGTCKDTLSIEDHEEIDIYVNAELVDIPIKLCDEMAVCENCVAFRKEDYLLQIIGNVED